MNNEHDSDLTSPEANRDAEGTSRETSADGSAIPESATIADGPARLRHSGPGIASFITALAACLLFAAMVLVIAAALRGRLASTTGITQKQLEDAGIMPTIFMAGIGMLASAAAAVISLILGIIGLVLKRRRKVFAVIGTVLSGLAVAALMLVVLLSLTAM